MAEHWRCRLPCIPLTTGKLKVLQEKAWLRDELRVSTRLAELGSSSAQVIRKLELNWAVVAEAFSLLEGKRKLQVDLAGILGATRVKILIGGKVFSAKCPRRHCFERDTFDHMLECYGIRDRRQTGPQAKPFLVLMTKNTLIPPATRRIPFYFQSYQRATVASASGDRTVRSGSVRQERAAS